MKRIFCLLLSVMLVFSALATACAADYSSEPEKLLLQYMKGSGVKGTLKLTSSGSADWAQLLQPLNGVELSLRILDSGKSGFQYRMYVEDGEDMTAMTEIVGADGIAYWTSDFLMDAVYTFPAPSGLVEGLINLVTGTTGWYTITTSFATMRDEDWKKSWEPQLTAYDAALDAWLVPFMSVDVVDVNGETQVINRYEIPMSALRGQLQQMISMLMQNPELLQLLVSYASDEQTARYLNTDYLTWYEQLIDQMPMTGSVIMERTSNVKGETLGYLIDLPAGDNIWGITEVTLKMANGLSEIWLISDTQTVYLSFSADEENRYSGHFRVVRTEGECIAVSYDLATELNTYVDAKARNHEEYTYTIRIEPDLSHLDALDATRANYADFEPINATLVVKCYSKSGKQTAVTSSFAFTMETGDSRLEALLSLKSTSLWHLPEAPEGDATDISVMTAEDRATLLDDWFMNGLLQLSVRETEAATATDLDAASAESEENDE